MVEIHANTRKTHQDKLQANNLHICAPRLLELNGCVLIGFKRSDDV
jgi:hypothetical protein